jgi:hypothetical protein
MNFDQQAVYAGRVMEPYAKKLQDFIREHFGVDVPLSTTASPPPSGPAIIFGSVAGYGDMYSGGVDVEELRLELPRADASEPLRVTYAVGIHQLSGQCDLDRLELSNARPDEIEGLRAIFMPRGTKPYDRDPSALVINGVRVDPWDAS